MIKFAWYNSAKLIIFNPKLCLKQSLFTVTNAVQFSNMYECCSAYSVGQRKAAVLVNIGGCYWIKDSGTNFVLGDS